jgi:HAD superfamily hydrolase (TIGR01509 family)
MKACTSWRYGHASSSISPPRWTRRASSSPGQLAESESTVISKSLLAICFDFGDTLIGEATEIKDDSMATLQAELIPGTEKMLHELGQRGYRLAIVSNGPVGSIPNVLGPYGLLDLFEVCAISQGLSIEKPDPRIFHYALDHLGISPEDAGRAVMAGNDLAADVAGANNVGMISVWLTWSPRRRKTQNSESEVLHHVIAEPADLVPLIEILDSEGMK